MKCPNCSNDLLSIFRCRYCSKSLCSLQCLEHHFSKFHILKTIPPSKINSPYLIKGFLNSSIYYDNFYSLDNYIPVYDITTPTLSEWNFPAKLVRYIKIRCTKNECDG